MEYSNAVGVDKLETTFNYGAASHGKQAGAAHIDVIWLGIRTHLLNRRQKASFSTAPSAVRRRRLLPFLSSISVVSIPYAFG